MSETGVETGAADRSRPSEQLIEAVRTSVIGEEDVVPGPCGHRRVTYADCTASGRALTFIEDYIRGVVLPLLAASSSRTRLSGLGRC